MGSWTSKEPQYAPRRKAKPDLQNLTPKPFKQIPVEDNDPSTNPETFAARELEIEDGPVILPEHAVGEAVETVSEYHIGKETTDPPDIMTVPKISLPKSASATHVNSAMEPARPKSAVEPVRPRVDPPVRRAKSEPVKRAGRTGGQGGGERATTQAGSTTSTLSTIGHMLYESFWHPQRTSRHIWNTLTGPAPAPVPARTMPASNTVPVEETTPEENAKSWSSEDDVVTGRPVAEQNEGSALLPQIVEEPLPENAGETRHDAVAAQQGREGQGEGAIVAASEGGTKVNVQVSVENPEGSTPVQVLEEVISIDKIIQPNRPLPEGIYQAALKGIPEAQLQEVPAGNPNTGLLPKTPETAVQNTGGSQDAAAANDLLALFPEDDPESLPEIDPLGPMAKFVRPAGYVLAVGAGIASLVGVVVGYNTIKGWLQKKKASQKGEGKQRRRRHVRDWTMTLD